MANRLKLMILATIGIALSTFSGCGGAGVPTGTPPSTTAYTIGGTVSGLSGTGLVLQDNGGNNLTVSANGAFVFTTPIASGSTYAVTVLTQPSNPAQSCAVTDGSGTATADVTNVQVACIGSLPSEVFPLWIMPASVAIAQQSSETVIIGINGGIVAGDDGSTSSMRKSRRAFVGARGKVEADDDSGFTSPATVQVSGLADGITVSPPSVVITPGGPPQLMTFSVSASAAPGNGTVTLTGTSTNLTSTLSVSFTIIPTSPATTMCPPSTPPPSPNPSAAPNEWTWESGANTLDNAGVYGTKGTPDAGNTPGARSGASAWTDAAGNLWLFGGYATETYVGEGDRNDLWKFTPATGEWTWVGGSNTFEQPGTYGTQGTPDPSNTPGARYEAMTWTDRAGNFWLFGGLGIDANGTRGNLNDLWKYSAGEWTWMGGPNTAPIENQPGVYGALGIPAPGNWPGPRSMAATWADACGNLWLFGGGGYDSTGTLGVLNDLWEYSGGEWRWMSGSNIADQNGTYGTLGTPAAGNVPGARVSPATWVDELGNLWLFGGEGNDLNGLQCEQGAGRPATSAIFGSTALENGPGWAGRT